MTARKPVRMVPAQPVRRHLELLALRGIRPSEVARRTGYTRAALSYIKHHAKRVRLETAEDIFTIRIPAPADLSEPPAADSAPPKAVAA